MENLKISDDVDKNNNLENVKSVYVKYLNGLHSPDDPWKMEQFDTSGSVIRGLAATRDIQANELIFKDRALVIGPRNNNYEHIFCIVCFKKMSTLQLCPFGCRLPICDNSCSDSDLHKTECDLIRAWEFAEEKNYSKVLFRSLAQIRGLNLSKQEKAVVEAMYCHLTEQVDKETDLLIKEFKNIPNDRINELKLILAALNTNAFETITSDQISVRGLFPLAALLNHNCMPNIRYTFDNSCIMHVYATKEIKKGEQIFNNYTKILWSTQNRRLHLAASKQFFCGCERCSDPTEFGTFISALRCTKPDCEGQLLPTHPTAVHLSAWLCDICSTRYNHKIITKILQLCTAILLNSIVKETVVEILKYLRRKVPSMLVSSNHFVLELKLQVIVRMDDDLLEEYQLEDYLDKASFCEEILLILDKLQAGDCYLKGFLYYGLFKAKEKISELTECDDKTIDKEKMLLEKCWTILGNTVSCPKDLIELKRRYQVE